MLRSMLLPLITSEHLTKVIEIFDAVKNILAEQFGVITIHKKGLFM